LIAAILGGVTPTLPAALLDPAAYTHRPAGVEMRETHISWALLAGELAFKLKKPLRLPFLDYGTLDRRHELCREEVRLNSRLAPLPRRVDARSPARGRRGGRAGGPGRRRPARALPRRGRYPTEPGTGGAGARGDARQNFQTLGELAVDPAMLDDTQRLAAAFLAGRRAELERRARSGSVRDGHGDLRAEHVVLERGIEVVDCVEFDPALRELDVALDLAFLAMDLRRFDERLARELVTAYREAGGDPGVDTLLDFFAAQRALIRAKVSLVRAGQVSGADAERRSAGAARLLDLAGRLGWSVRLGPIVIVCGGAATGKSTLAERSGARVISSDVVRKELLGIEAPVVVDATFRYAADRQAFAAAAGAGVWIECRAPAAVARRAAARSSQPDRVSDADAAIATRQLAEWEPLTEPNHVVVATDRSPEASVLAARDALDERLASS
jgi:aminoglycoside phosphotransferase family enzyme/predicted kinase